MTDDTILERAIGGAVMGCGIIARDLVDGFTVRETTRTCRECGEAEHFRHWAGSDVQGFFTTMGWLRSPVDMTDICPQCTTAPATRATTPGAFIVAD